jgi:hypothetical protein
MYQIIKFQIMELNPFRLKRLLLLKEQQLANVNNGWGNTHYELLDARKEMARLGKDRDRWRDIAAHLLPETTVGCPMCDEIIETVRREQD